MVRTLMALIMLIAEREFSDDDYHYFIEDSVTVELMSGDDELEPM